MLPNLKKIWQKRKKVRFPIPKEALIFLFFLVVSTLFWLLYTLSKPYEAVLTVPISYRNIPEKYLITNALPSEMNMTVKGTGIKLLFAEFNQDSLCIDLHKKFGNNERKFVVSYQELKKMIADSIHVSTEIQDFTPKEIEVNFLLLRQKKLPVRLAENLQLARQYVLKDDAHIEPDSVTVFAPQSVLDQLTEVYAQMLHLGELSKSTVKNVEIQPITNTRFLPRTVRVSIPIEAATEKTLEIPVSGINFPPDLQLRTFPATVSVRFLVGLSRFEKTTANDIKVYLDYKTLISNADSKQKLHYSTSVSGISNLKITPDAVEYIMEENLLTP